jgi:hypothetical protein
MALAGGHPSPEADQAIYGKKLKMIEDKLFI